MIMTQTLLWYKFFQHLNLFSNQVISTFSRYLCCHSVAWFTTVGACTSIDRDGNKITCHRSGSEYKKAKHDFFFQLHIFRREKKGNKVILSRSYLAVGKPRQRRENISRSARTDLHKLYLRLFLASFRYCLCRR